MLKRAFMCYEVTIETDNEMLDTLPRYWNAI